MEFVFAFAQSWLQALLQLLAQPFYYIGMIFIILHYRWQVRLERIQFHTRLHSLLDETWRTIAWGFVGGIAASIVLTFAGAVADLPTIVWIWGISIVLSLFRARYFCVAYAVGVAGLLHAVVQWIPVLREWQQLKWLIDPLEKLNVPSLLLIVAVIHGVEALFIRFQGARLASAMLSGSKRGKAVGGYLMQGFWPLPLFLLVPGNVGSEASMSSGISLPWMPVMGGELWNGGWLILAFPVVIGLSEWTIRNFPEVQAKRSAIRVAWYAVAVLIFAATAYVWPSLAVVGAIGTIALHEILNGYTRWQESGQVSLFARDEHGLKILAVLPRSPGDAMGLEAGEIIRKVNGERVTTEQAMHQALQLNPAFCRLEVVNREGQSKFVKRALFAGDHHQLGVILVPGKDAAALPAHKKEASLADYLFAGWR